MIYVLSVVELNTCSYNLFDHFNSLYCKDKVIDKKHVWAKYVVGTSTLIVCVCVVLRKPKLFAFGPSIKYQHSLNFLDEVITWSN